MKVLVTGSTGFIGSHIVEVLLAARHEPVAFARRTGVVSLLTSLGVQIRYGDVTDPDSLGTALRGCDGVVHAAGLVSGAGGREDYERVNVEGTRNLVGVAEAVGVHRLVNISSLAVYARPRQRGVVIDETAPLFEKPPPWDFYSRTKLLADRIALATHQPGRLEVTSIRPGFTFGPRDYTFSAAVASALRAGRLLLPGGGRTLVPCVYVADLARLSVLCLEREEAQGHSFACITHEPITYAQLMAMFAKALDAPPPRLGVPYCLAYALGFGAELLWRAAGRRGTPPLSRFIVCAMRVDARFLASGARELLGWRAETDLREAVRCTVAWARTAGLA